jgi:hypothetical protein
MRMIWPWRGEIRASDHFDLLRGAVTAGLVLSATVPLATLPVFLRSAAMVLAGRALTAGVARAEACGYRCHRPWATRIAIVWAVTFLPVALLPNPDAMRSCAAAAGLALALCAVPRRFVSVLAGALLLAALLLAGDYTHSGPLGNIEYALGVTWPRGWNDLALVAGLFLVGGLWARAGGPQSFSVLETRPAPAWMDPLCALGRLPIAVLLMHSLAMSAFAASGAVLSPLGVLARSLALLLAEIWVAQRWISYVFAPPHLRHRTYPGALPRE